MSGGIASLTPDTVEGAITTYNMPKTENDLWHLIDSMSPDSYDYDSAPKAIIEKVHSMPGQGVASMFKFGMGYGQLRMALVSASISFETVTPRTWQKAFGIIPRAKTESKTDFKNRLKAKAQELFPKANMTLAVCDAVLIAEYCRRLHSGYFGGNK